MRRTMIAVLTALFTLLIPSTAHAGTYLDQAVEGLKHAPVFVATGTENTGVTTVSTLTGQLSDGDNIVIVMLPDAAQTEGSAEDFAGKLDEATGHRHIVAVSVGSKVATTTKLLPAGVGQDLLSRATGVATNTTETLGIFARNVHDWQSRHPEEVAKLQPPPAASDEGGPGFGWHWIGIISAVLFVAAIALVFIIGKRGKDDTTQPKLPDPPDALQGYLRTIRKLTPQIHHTNAKQALTEVCDRISVLFDTLRRNAKPHEVQLATDAFTDRLERMAGVVDRYVRIQREPEYWPGDTEKHLSDGRQSFASFNGKVLRAIQAANDGQLTEFTVDTRILDATRYE